MSPPTTCRNRCARSPRSASCSRSATGTQLDERGVQYIAFAVDGAKRMQILINDLLTFSRVGRLNDAREPVDLGRALDTGGRATWRASVEESEAPGSNARTSCPR